MDYFFGGPFSHNHGSGKSPTNIGRTRIFHFHEEEGYILPLLRTWHIHYHTRHFWVNDFLNFPFGICDRSLKGIYSQLAPCMNQLWNFPPANHHHLSPRILMIWKISCDMYVVGLRPETYNKNTPRVGGCFSWRGAYQKAKATLTKQVDYNIWFSRKRFEVVETFLLKKRSEMAE